MKNRITALATATLLASGVFVTNDGIYAQESEDVIETTNNENQEEQPVLKAQASASTGIALNATNFPDAALREYIAQTYDSDGDGVLSDSESNTTLITLLDLPITDLTGLELFTQLKTLNLNNTSVVNVDVTNISSLEILNVRNNAMAKSINVQNMNHLNHVYNANNPNLKTLHFENCNNLVYADHTANGETVYITAGMTNFVGCWIDPYHTGNLIIDVNGYYTENTDGTKSLDLDAVISPTLFRF